LLTQKKITSNNSIRDVDHAVAYCKSMQLYIVACDEKEHSALAIPYSDNTKKGLLFVDVGLHIPHPVKLEAEKPVELELDNIKRIISLDATLAKLHYKADKSESTYDLK
jgi:hypothetical protein